jgi:hypothetical protein
MATNRHPIRHPHRGRVNHARRMTLYGPDPRWDAFDTEEEAGAAWAQHRERILEHYPGRRPMGWWHFEAGDLRYPGYDRERSTLYETGLLGEAERAELVGGGSNLSGRRRPTFGSVPALDAPSKAHPRGASITNGPTFRARCGCDGRASTDAAAKRFASSRRRPQNSRCQPPDKKGPRALAGGKEANVGDAAPSPAPQRFPKVTLLQALHARYVELPLLLKADAGGIERQLVR